MYRTKPKTKKWENEELKGINGYAQNYQYMNAAVY